MSPLKKSTEEGRYLTFYGDAVEAHTLMVTSLQGREAVSSLYRFEVDLVSNRADIDSAKMLAQPAWIGIKEAMAGAKGGAPQIRTLQIHGALASFEQFDSRGDGKAGLNWVIYKAVFVPRVWRLSLDLRSRIFLDATVPEIVESILKDAGFEKGKDYEFRLARKDYAKREYVVQYGESTWSFVSRWMEHEGISYHFLQGDRGETLVIGDGPDCFGPVLGMASVSYRPRIQLPKGWMEEETIAEFSSLRRRVPAGVILKDYNYRNDADLKADSPISEGGAGTLYEYGDHYKDPAEGKRLAQTRAEELRCREHVFSGRSDVRSFRAGAVSQLEGHYRQDLNQRYLLTEVTHSAEQTLVLGQRSTSQAYVNTFTCIPATVPFRPARATPKPKVAGLLNARIDAAGEGEYAEVDAEGRYKVVFPFDLSGRGGGTATRWVRMAQPYLGAGFGMHFPLHKGTEVVVAHVNGDPDRPIIVGAVATPKAPSPVVDKNSTQCVLKSGGNNAIVFDDLKGEERWFLRAQKNQEIRVENDVFERVGHDRHLTVKHDQIEHVENDLHQRIDRDHIQDIQGNRHLTLQGNESIDIAGRASLTVEGDVVHVLMAGHSEETTGKYYLKANGIVIESPSGLTLKCGGNSVVIDAAGVTLTGAALTLDGATTKINSGPGSAAVSGAAGSAATPIAAAKSIEPGDLEAGAAAQAGEGTAAAGAPEAKTSWVEVELKDDKGKPIPKELYEVVFPDGTVIRGRLDKKGKSKVKGCPSGEGKIGFPRLDKGGWSKG
ncbi:MAG: type VI secretion system tip protein VgrG [Planctomycetes bacterium]|nr:type VI secretion system tip protein VgrG [Planctomycetota bacterium]